MKKKDLLKHLKNKEIENVYIGIRSFDKNNNLKIKIASYLQKIVNKDDELILLFNDFYKDIEINKNIGEEKQLKDWLKGE